MRELINVQGRLAAVRFAPLPTQPWGLILTHEEQQLLAAAEDAVQMLDVSSSGNVEQHFQKPAP